MILSLLYLGLVFYFPLEITETRVVYSFSFVQQFPKSCPHPEVRERERETMQPTMKSNKKSNYKLRSRCTTCGPPLPSVGSTNRSTHKSNNREMACATPIIFTPLHNTDIVEVEARVWMVYIVATIECHPR
jgi:hypothetical protein